MLLELGFIEEDRLEVALVEARTSAMPLGRYLVESGEVEENLLVSALSRHLGVHSVDPVRTPIHPKVLELVPRELANRHRVVPIARKREDDAEKLLLATTDPFADEARRAVEAILPPETTVSWLLCGETDMAAALLHHYGISTEDLPFADADLVEQTKKPTGEAFGDYELGKRIGTGGMAEIFLANVKGVTGPAAKLAIKRLLPKLASDEEARQAFVGEAELCVGLRHPNVVQVHHLGEADGALFIAMEFVDGRDLLRVLGEYVKQDKEVPVPVALHVVMQILQGLDYCHEAVDADGEPLGIVHRDVSPSNVLISKQGDVKLSDFGIARAEESAAGKNRYMAPEQIEGRPIDRRTDVFAAGLVAFELLTRRPLFDNDAEEVLRTLDTDFSQRLRHHRDDLPEDLEAILARALATKPDERFQTAAEMRDAIYGVVAKNGWGAGAKDVAAFVSAVFPEGDALDTQERLAYPRPRPQFKPDTVTTLQANVESAYDRFQTAPPKMRAAILGVGFVVIAGVLIAVSSGDDDEVDAPAPLPTPIANVGTPPPPPPSKPTPPPSAPREVLPGLFAETAPDGHFYVKNEVPLRRRADRVRAVATATAGRLVRHLEDAGDNALVLMVPHGPAGFVPKAELVKKTPTGAYVARLNEGACSVGRRESVEDCMFEGKQRFDGCVRDCGGFLRPGLEEVDAANCRAICQAAFDDCLGHCQKKKGRR